MSISASTPFDLDQSELESMDQILDSLQEEVQPTVKGELVTARVIAMDDRDILFDVGQKQDGRCPIQEFDQKPAVGDEIPVIVMQGDAEGLIRLSRREARKRIAWQNVKEAYEAKASLSGTIGRVIDHGYQIEFQGLNLFMPLSQSNLKNLIRNRFALGKEIDFRVLEIRDHHQSAIISHRQILEERNDESWQQLLSQCKPGDIVEGEVVKRVSFGLFIRVHGIEGLLHQNDISWKKNASFKNRFQNGEKLQVRILDMDQESNRLSLGIKQLTEDPWDWAARELKTNAIVKGTVTSVTDYGAFIELREGLEGLAHVSELSWSRRQKHPKRYVEPDQVVEAMVLGVDLEEKRISLGLKQLQSDPWQTLLHTIKIGDVREGTISSVTKFGAFVEVLPDVEGLIHFKDYGWDDKVDRQMLKKGDTVSFKILDINAEERRLGCGIKQLTKSPWQELSENRKTGAVITGKITNVTDFGLFVDIGDGFEGLVHISRLPDNLKEVDRMKEAYKKGDEVQTVLQKIDVANQRISLSIKALEQKQNRELMQQHMKSSEPSTTSMGAFFKNIKIPEKDSDS
ncbi:MAG: S1 RNA-binding domain-containing protein [Leptospiraceae bacterium]|nr:S1 RNA-binding domain-containing protein [Leptospiraceae bacterium]